MDDKARKAEELLEERARKRGPNGGTATHWDGSPDELANGPIGNAVGAAERAADEKTPDENLQALQRMAADFANYRKRTDAERIEFAKFAKADLIARLLDILDAYDRALATVPEELKSSSWVEGMWLIERKFRQILDSEGLKAIDSLGEPFDPYQHEAVAHVESDAPEGTVITEHQKAYRLHDRVIRPAMVTVAKKKES
ncbi:MAG TPA: nucleotide exchange factor GrpE [Candidatus Limnocylindrales bacterium]|nr:nucleotide exchange factor GrpE [Candidatus Limnocylindrales bacterium]